MKNELERTVVVWFNVLLLKLFNSSTITRNGENTNLEVDPSFWTAVRICRTLCNGVKTSIPEGSTSRISIKPGNSKCRTRKHFCHFGEAGRNNEYCPWRPRVLCIDRAECVEQSIIQKMQYLVQNCFTPPASANPDLNKVTVS